MGSFLYPDRFFFFPYIVAEMGYPSSRDSIVKEHPTVTPRMMAMPMMLPSSYSLWWFQVVSRCPPFSSFLSSPPLPTSSQFWFLQLTYRASTHDCMFTFTFDLLIFMNTKKILMWQMTSGGWIPAPLAIVETRLVISSSSQTWIPQEAGRKTYKRGICLLQQFNIIQNSYTY